MLESRQSPTAAGLGKSPGQACPRLIESTWFDIGDRRAG
jgi:hypothetical protein